ncbi:hypothetical protein BDR05DRAFT_959940 [Suillus weaverae]|nr:hypothetical protein BDR05DRAFT_959940 [Suillus weaverae]
MEVLVRLKHGGKTIGVLHRSLPSGIFKDAVYQVTGVLPERMTIMIKGSVLNVRELVVVGVLRYDR